MKILLMDGMGTGFWKDKNVLVTGGAGFIGSHLVDKLLEIGANVTIADNLSKGSLNNIFEVWNKHGLKFSKKIDGNKIHADGHTFIKCDLEDRSQVREVVNNQDIVIHLAATIGGRGYIDTHPAECCQNFAINHNVFSEAYKAGVERVHYSSTACVYPIDLQSKYDSSYLLKEEDAFKHGWANCDGEYGWSKFMGEIELQAFHKEYGLKCSITRYVTAYGERENDTHAIIALIRKAVERNDPYVVWGTGEQDRDFTYVSDIVEATLLATEKITDGTPINVGTSIRYKIKDVVNKILEFTGHKPSRIIFDESKPTGVASRALDISRAKQLLGWSPKVSLEEGLKRTIKWYLEARPVSVESII
jgi:UDP-glucose 4-epimerase